MKGKERTGWIGWAFLEGTVFRTSTRTIQKYLGAVSKTVPGALLTTLLSALVQVAVGFIGARIRSKSLLADRRQIAVALTSGIVSALMMFLGLLAFIYKGDMGIVTFIVSLSIIPGAVIDRLFWGNKLVKRQFLALLFYVLAGYSILGFPNLQTFLSLPIWVWISFAIALLFAINEALGRTIAKKEKVVNFFWVGLGTSFTSLVWLTIIRGWFVASDVSTAFWILSIMLGFLTVMIFLSRFISYQKAATITKKKVVMQGSYLVTVMLVGVIFYAEPLTAGKIIGIPFFLIAFLLMEREVWKAVRQHISGALKH